MVAGVEGHPPHPSRLGGVPVVLALQEDVDIAEVGSVRLVTPPALAHQVIYLLRAQHRLRQQHLRQEGMAEMCEGEENVGK